MIESPPASKGLSPARCTSTALALLACAAAVADEAPTLVRPAFSVDSRPGTPAARMYRNVTQDLTVGCPADLVVAAGAAVSQPGQFESYLLLPDGSRQSQLKTGYTISGSVPHVLPTHGEYLLKSGSLDGLLRLMMNVTIGGNTTTLELPRPFSVSCLRADTPAGLYNIHISASGNDAQGKFTTVYPEAATPDKVTATLGCPADLHIFAEIITRTPGRADGVLTLDDGKRVGGVSMPVGQADPADQGLPHVQGIGAGYQLHPGQSYKGGLHLSVQFPDGGTMKSVSLARQFDVSCQ